MEISAAMVMDLRKQTGLPMMECKKALAEAGGDVAKAIDWLKQRGLKKLADRADNLTPNGRVFVATDAASKRVAMVGVGCETEPVVATDDFQKLGASAAAAALKLDEPDADALRAAAMPGESGKTVGDFMDDVLNRIREKIVLLKAATYSGDVGSYVHHNGMVGVLVQFNQPCPPELAADVCMHIAAMNPRCLNRDQAPADEAAAERAKYVEEVQGKPANIVENIVNGKMNRWYSEFVLLDQPFVKDDKKSVQQALSDAGKGLTITRYTRMKIGA